VPHLVFQSEAIERERVQAVALSLNKCIPQQEHTQSGQSNFKLRSPRSFTATRLSNLLESTSRGRGFQAVRAKPLTSNSHKHFDCELSSLSTNPQFRQHHLLITSQDGYRSRQTSCSRRAPQYVTPRRVGRSNAPASAVF
jgi:hypothetical protein